jgi:uncharacterized SAM-binding protein YcdF (DUF218 family)
MVKPKGAERKLRGKSLWLVNFILLMIPVTYWGYEPVLRYSASLIIINSQPRKADAVVLLSGGEPGRAWGAADLYRGKWAPYVVITQEPVFSDTRQLREMGIEINTGMDNNLRILQGLGVPPDKIIRVESVVESTFDEMTKIRGLLKNKGWKSLIVVTSNYHTRRTRLIARYVFGPGIDVVVVGSPHGGLERDNWWKNREDQRTFLIEFEKLVAYTLYIWPRLLL